jgi:hypothetical protein
LLKVEWRVIPPKKRDVFVQNLPAFSLRKILLLSTSVLRGITGGPNYYPQGKHQFRCALPN